MRNANNPLMQVRKMATAEKLLQMQNETEIRRCRVTIPSTAKLYKLPFQTEIVLKHFSLSFSKTDGTPHEILLEDLVGVTVLPKPPDSNRKRQTCRLLVNEYPSVIQKGKNNRELKSVWIDFDGEESFEENRRVAQEWKEAVLVECNRAVKKTFEFADECKGACMHAPLIPLSLPHSLFPLHPPAWSPLSLPLSRPLSPPPPPPPLRFRESLSLNSSLSYKFACMYWCQTLPNEWYREYRMPAPLSMHRLLCGMYFAAFRRGLCMGPPVHGSTLSYECICKNCKICPIFLLSLCILTHYTINIILLCIYSTMCHW